MLQDKDYELINDLWTLRDREDLNLLINIGLGDLIIFDLKNVVDREEFPSFDVVKL